MYSAEDFPPVHMRDHLRIVRKHKWTAILFFLLVVGLTGLYLLVSSPKYAGTVKLVLKPPPFTPLTMMGEIVYSEGIDIVSKKLFTTTQFEVFKSTEVAEKVMDRLDLWKDYHLGEEKKSFFGGKPKVITREMAAESFAAQVSAVTPTMMSNHIEVTFTAKDPEKAARVANTLIDAYLEVLFEDRSVRIRENLEWLQKEFERLDQDVIEADQALQDFKKKRDMISVDDKENILLQKLHALNTSLVQARIARIAAENAYLDAKQLENDPTQLENVPLILASNPQIAGLSGQLNAIKTEYARSSERYMEKHPRMIELRSTMDELEGRIRAEVLKAVESLKISYEMASSQENSLREELEAAQKEVIRADEEKIHYLQLMNTSKANRVLFDTLLSRLKETVLLQDFESPKESVQIIQKALPPDEPAGYRPFFLPIAAGVGLLVGLFLCYVRDYFDTTIQNERDIHEILGLSLLGILPDRRRAPLRKKPSLEKAPWASPEDPYVEFLHHLASIVHHKGTSESCKTLLITSACPREGRTTLTTNLGIALAQRGLRVLLVDGDLRKPGLHQTFSLDGTAGLSTLLETGGDPGPYIRETEIANLHCLPAGPCPSIPSVSLESARVSRLMETLKAGFDWVLIDSSALLEAPEAVALAQWTDAALWVIASGVTSGERAAWAKRSLTLMNCSILGIVLNRVRFLRGPTYYYTARR
jgi:succinoglycan biosynthesis transport protein ExoP